MVGPLSLSENNKIVFEKYECILGPWSKILLQPHFCCKIISRFSTLDIHLLKIIYHQFLLLMIAAACLYVCLYMEQDRSQRCSSRSCCIILPTQEHKPINLNMNLSRPQNNISISPVWVFRCRGWGQWLIVMLILPPSFMGHLHSCMQTWQLVSSVTASHTA